MAGTITRSAARPADDPPAETIAFGKRLEMIVLLAAAAVIVAAPIAAALLVSLASLREDARHSLGGKPPSRLTRAARRLLSVQPRGVVRGSAPRASRPRVPQPRVPGDEELTGRLSEPKV
jgi:hypothetical protein